jgi:ubiquinone/menaquinone biosynthesis C-methylase UbiE
MEWFKRLYTKNFIEVVGFPPREQTELETKFIKQVLKLPPNSKILDLCCGYGRHTYSLSREGDYKMTGVDLSDDYLKIAKSKFSAPNIDYFKGDMRNLSFKDYFDAVINLFTSFGFFESNHENEKVLQEINKTLKKNGLFLLDYENKFFFVFNDVFKKERFWKKVGDNRYYLCESSYDIINEREIFNAHLIKNGKVEASTGYNIRLYSFPEIKSMLVRNGFEIKQVWGDYFSNPYSVKSKRLIILSKKVSQKK